MELGCGLRFRIEIRVTRSNEKEGEKTPNIKLKPEVGTERSQTVHRVPFASVASFFWSDLE